MFCPGVAPSHSQVFVDTDADLELAAKLVVDSKCDYPSACNAMETLLVHTDLTTPDRLPELIELVKTLKFNNVTVHAGYSWLGLGCRFYFYFILFDIRFPRGGLLLPPRHSALGVGHAQPGVRI